MTADLLSNYTFTDHALFEMSRRSISREDVAATLAEPDQMEQVRVGRMILQRIFHLGDPPSAYLLRIVVDVDRRPAEIVTAYRTSKIGKYWRDEP